MFKFIGELFNIHSVAICYDLLRLFVVETRVGRPVSFSNDWEHRLWKAEFSTNDFIVRLKLLKASDEIDVEFIIYGQPMVARLAMKP
ncbi:hypothetical protein GA003_17235 [Opitutia bacterium ISCC 52]|nr:hypothetical protein GA003_17235 [Opitutae bacterium ISCC 52]